jgi:hypothetical protein
MQMRMFSPAASGPGAVMRQNPLNVNGRVYTPSAGATFDVADFDAPQLSANGWVSIAPSGPTSARPSPLTTSAPYIAGIGTHFFDQTLGKIVVFDGAVWRDPATAAVV